jgi:hypothetical protein
MKQIARTYRLSEESVNILNRLAREFSERLGSQMPYSKLVDSLIFYCRDVSFAEVVNKTKDD